MHPQTNPNMTITLGSARVLTAEDGAARLAAAKAAIAAKTVISDDPASPANASIVPGIPDRAPAVPAKPQAAAELTEGYIALGYQSGNNYIWSSQRRCVVCLDGNAVTTVTLETHGGASWLFSTYGEKTENGGTKLNLARARSDLISACQRAGFYKPDQVKGSGVWYAAVDGVKTIVCNSGDAIFDAAGNRVPRATRSSVFAEGRPTGMSPQGAAATDAEVVELAELFDTFAWSNPSDAALALGWTALAPFSGALTHCPILALQAPPESGKSALLTVIQQLLGTGCAPFNGVKTTSAGVTHDLQADSVPVLLDEVFAAHGVSKRDTARVDSMLTLLRSAFNAASSRIGTGTADGKGATYSSRFCALIASRTFPDMDDQDRSRMAFCRLKLFDRSKRPHRLFGREERLQELGSRLKMRLFYNWSKFVETVDNLREVMVYELGHRPRFHEVFGQLIAGWYVVMTGRAASLAEARLVIEQFNLAPHNDRINGRTDERDCADWLLGHKPHGSSVSVGELLRRASGSYTSAADKAQQSAAMAALEDVGVKVNGEYAQICAGTSIQGLRKVFEDSAYQGGKWAALFETVKGSKTTNPRFCGKTMKAVAVPLSWLFDEPVAPAQSALSL